MEEYFSKKRVITGFTSNRDVILNFSPPINCNKILIEKNIDAFEDIIKQGIEKLVFKFVKKNII